jgi:hypothetical protein
MVGFMKRFSEPYRRAREIAARPAFGPLTAYEARFTFGVYPPRSVYDFLNGFGCHHLDLARFLCGDIAWVFATRATCAPGDTREWRPGALDLPVTGSAWRDMWQLAEGRAAAGGGGGRRLRLGSGRHDPAQLARAAQRARRVDGSPGAVRWRAGEP